MALMEVGRVCRKVAGRDAGGYCIIVEKADDSSVVVEGERVRRKKVSMSHLEPLPLTADVKKGAGRSDVVAALEKAGLIA